VTSGSDNYGIQIGGSASVHAGAMAGGPGARAYARDTNLGGADADRIEALQAAVAALVEQLRAAPPGVSDPAALARIAESVQVEVARERPNKGIISGLLAAIVAGAGGVASIASAVAAIQHAVGALL
jgi:hypothetical protein